MTAHIFGNTVRMRLPHGYIGLDVTADRLQITERRQRRVLFWRRWRTKVLASVPCRIKVDDTVTLAQLGGDGYVAMVNGDAVLTWAPKPPSRYRGFGIRA